MIDTKQPIECEPCGFAGSFTKNNWFTGKLVVKRDLDDEQHYYSGKQWLHNRRLHGSGIVCGLQVLEFKDGDDACKQKWITVEPGFALDCCGREIIVSAEEQIDFTSFPAVSTFIKSPPPLTPQAFDVFICFRQCGTEPIPVLYDECGCDEDRCLPNRILESYRFDVRLSEASSTQPPPATGQPAPADPTPAGPGGTEQCTLTWNTPGPCPDCEEECILLATITGYAPGLPILDALPPNQQPPADAPVHATIDLSGRRYLASTSELQEVIECLVTHQGSNGTQGTGLETNLVSIDQLSWEHGRVQPFSKFDFKPLPQTLPGALTTLQVPPSGVFVRFNGKIKIPRPHNADLKTELRLVCEYMMRIFEVKAASATQDNPALTCRCNLSGIVWPLILQSGSLTLMSDKDFGKDVFADGLAFLFNEASRAEVLRIATHNSAMQTPLGLLDLFTQIHGDFIFDTSGRSISAEFVRAELPSGQRQPKLGLQGDVFESWLYPVKG